MKLVDLDKPISQRQLGIILNCSREAISQAAQAGILREGGTLAEWLQDLHKSRTESAAGRHGNGPLDLAQERAKLAALQSEKLQIELDGLRKKLWPLDAICEALEWHVTNMRTNLLSLPHRFKSLEPSITPKQIDGLDDLIRGALGDLGRSRLPQDFVAIAEKYYLDRQRGAQSLFGVEDQNGRTGKRASKKATRNQERKLAQNTNHLENDRERCQAGS